MLKSYTLWIKATSVIQLFTGLVHSMSLFSSMEGTNETENQLLNLMTTYKMDMGGGFNPTMMNVFIALSSCFTLLYLFGGLVNFYLLKKLAPENWRGYLLINLLIFGTCSIVMYLFTFLPPIILTGLVTVLLLISYLTAPVRTK